MTPAALLAYAVRLSATSPNVKWRLAAVLVGADGWPVLGEGVNSTHCAVGGPPWTEHAEEAAVLQVIEEHGSAALRGASVYVARTSPRTGRPLLARPCGNCAALLARHGVSHVTWTGVSGELVTVTAR